MATAEFLPVYSIWVRPLHPRSLRTHHLVEFGEELAGKLFRGGIDQAGAELGDLSA